MFESLVNYFALFLKTHLLFSFVCGHIDWIYVFVSHVWKWVQRTQGGSDPLWLELQTIVSCLVGSGNLTCPSARTATAFSCWINFLQTLPSHPHENLIYEWYIYIISLLLFFLIPPISQPLLKFMTFYSLIMITCMNTTCWDHLVLLLWV